MFILVVGVGPKSFQADGIAECLFAAVDDFCSHNKKTSVTDVHLVVHDSNISCKPSIMSVLQSKTTAASSQSALKKFLGIAILTLKVIYHAPLRRNGSILLCTCQSVSRSVHP